MITYCIKSVVPRRKFNALGAMGLISTVVNAGMQDYQNRKNRDAQEYMLREAQAFQRELNANSTLTQKQSLQRAGLPVSLMTGPGDYSASTVLGDSSSQQAPTIDSTIFMQAAQQRQQQPLIDAEVDKTKAEKNLIEKQAGVAESDKLLKDAQRWSLEQLTPEQKKQFEEGTKKLIAEVEKIKVDKSLVEKTIDKVMEETDALRISNNLMLAETPLILQKYAMEIALLNSQGQLTDAQTLVAYKSLSVMDAQIKNLVSQAHLNDKQALYVSQEALRVAIDNQYKPFEKANELELSDQQIRQAKQMVENLKQSYNWVPFNNIVGAVSGTVGNVAGAYAGARFGVARKPGSETGFVYPITSTYLH